MTPNTKTLLSKLIDAINFKTVITTCFTGVLIWLCTIMLTAFQSVQKQMKEDHTTIKMLVPAVKVLQKADSVRTIKESKDAVNDAIMNANMEEIKEDLKDLKPLIYTVIKQTKD